MLKGINRYIIELHDPDNEYFDKVLLFVKPRFSENDYGKLCREGERIVNSAKRVYKIKPAANHCEKNRIRMILCLILGVGVGIGSILLMKVL